MITYLFCILALFSTSSFAEQKSNWQIICRNKPIEVSGCQAVSSPSTVGSKTIRLLVRLSVSAGRPQVIILSDSKLYSDRSYRGRTAITIDDNKQMQFNYIEYFYTKNSEANMLSNVADTPLLSQMKNGRKLEIDIEYSDGVQHTHEIRLIGFTRAMRQL